MTRDILQWLASTASHGCTEISFWKGCTLEEEASNALLTSVAAKTIKSLTLWEIYLTPEQLGAILTIPMLEVLKMNGDISYDWDGTPAWIFTTLEKRHINVLLTSPHAQRLRVLELHSQ
jgi:hypothetical protein